MKRNVFERGTDSFPSIDKLCWAIHGENLSRLVTGMVSHLEAEQRLELGTLVADKNVPAIADGDHFFQRHCAVVGSTGSGKSWATALILERASKLCFPNLVVFDIHGEYTALPEADPKIYQSLSLFGPDLRPEIGQRALFLPYWLLNSTEIQALILDRSDENAPNQASRLLHHLQELKAEKLWEQGVEDVNELFTTDSPIPYSLDELLRRLREGDTERVPGARAGIDKAGEFNGKLNRFISRLETKIGDRRLGFMFTPQEETSEREWLESLAVKLLSSNGASPGIKILDLSQEPSDILPVVTGLLGRLIFDLQFWIPKEVRTPVALVCDEAHLYMASSSNMSIEQHRASTVFERIAREGRKYGTALMVVSQRPSKISQTILSQVNNFLVLRLTNDRDRAAVASQ